MVNRLLNYTSKVPVETSLGEIMGMLVSAGATNISTRYDPASRRPVGLSFSIPTADGESVFALPARVSAAVKVMNEQGVLHKERYYASRTRQEEERRRVTQANMQQGEIVAWRILRDWMEAQLALIQLGMAELSEIMLPYLVMEDGKTLYQFAQDKGFLALPKPGAA